MTIGPKTQEEKFIFAEETFRIEIQQLLHELMGGSMFRPPTDNQELADQLNIPLSDVEKFFESEWNPTIREVARIFSVFHIELKLEEKE